MCVHVLCVCKCVFAWKNAHAKHVHSNNSISHNSDAVDFWDWDRKRHSSQQEKEWASKWTSERVRMCEEMEVKQTKKKIKINRCLKESRTNNSLHMHISEISLYTYELWMSVRACARAEKEINVFAIYVYVVYKRKRTRSRSRSCNIDTFSLHRQFT